MKLKKSFTLVEIIIAIILVSIIYSIAINSFSKKTINISDNIKLVNLKEKLLSYEYLENITIKCIADDLSCFIFKDDSEIPEDDKIEKLFIEKPIVYEYNKNLNQIEFLDLELEQLQRYEIVFEYSCNKYRKCSEFIVDTQDEVYIYNDINKKPDTIKYLNDIDEYFYSRIEEVKDAF